MIHQTEKRLHTIISQLRKTLNSDFAIHSIPDALLHEIFTLAIYSSEHPDNTALTISHVCRFWRKLTLAWPTLWRFLNLNNLPAIKLFVDRSNDIPLSLWCIWDYVSHPTKSYFKSRASLILPRLNSLTLHVSHSKLLEIQRLLRDPQFPPLRLQQLDFKLVYDSRLFNFREDASSTVTDYIQVDISCFRELKLEGTNLPWLQLPHNKLTHFKLRNPLTPPTLSQLWNFLSNCPLLIELEFGLGCRGDRNILADSSVVNTLEFPNLKKLIFTLDVPTSYEFDYLQKLSACIRPLESLLQFKLTYDNFFDNGRNLNSPFSIFGPIPSGTFSQFGRHGYLSINVKFDAYSFQIYSAPSTPQHHYPSSYPLILSGNWTSRIPLNRAPILDLIRAMPEITHLCLCSDARQILTLWDFDVGDALPRLRTLELLFQPSDAVSITWLLNSLPQNLQLKTLIMTGVRLTSFDFKPLYDAVLRAGIGTLELSVSNFDDVGLSDVVSILRQAGIKVSVKWIC